MKTLVKAFVLLALLRLVAGCLGAAETARSEIIARGYYLANNVGLCADCHSPRDRKGQFVEGMHLKGSALAFAPTVPLPAWAPVAPAISGLPTMTEEQAVKFLRTGVRPDGSRPAPPMPEFRLDETDARALAAYLKSLPR